MMVARLLAAVTDVHDVAVLGDVFFAFEPQDAFGSGVGFRARFQQCVPRDGLGADEVFFEVGMDGSGCLRSFGVDWNRPGSAFVFAHGEEGHQAEQLVRRAYQPREAAFRQAVAGKEIRGVGLAHFGKLGFDLSADGGCARVGSGRDFLELVFRNRLLEILAEGCTLADVQYVENGFLTQEHEASNQLFLVSSDCHFAQRLFGFEVGFGALEQSEFLFQLGRAALFQVFFQALQAFFRLAEVADDEVEVNVLDVAQRIVFSDVRNGGIVEGTQHVGEGVDGAEVGDVGGVFESVLPDGAYVDIFNGGMHQFLGIALRGKAVEAVVGNLGDADVGFAGVGVCGSAGLGQNAKEGGLANLGKSNNSGFHKHFDDSRGGRNLRWDRPRVGSVHALFRD